MSPNLILGYGNKNTNVYFENRSYQSSTANKYPVRIFPNIIKHFGRYRRNSRKFAFLANNFFKILKRVFKTK